MGSITEAAPKPKSLDYYHIGVEITLMRYVFNGTAPIVSENTPVRKWIL